MKINRAQIDILVNRDGTEINLYDADASVCFARISLTPEQFQQALSRLGYVPCEVDVANFEKVGKRMEYKTFEFEIPEANANRYADKKDSCRILCEKALKESEFSDWASDNCFSSRNSFFYKDGKPWARTTIRRWI